MNKLLMCAICALLAPSVMAQDAGLFPELEGRFQQAEPETVKTTTETITVVEGIDPEAQVEETVVEEESLDKEEAQPVTDAVQTGAVAPEEILEPAGEGNVEIYFTDMKGTLALARNYSYCMGDVVLENKTNVKLDKLVIDLNYQGMPNMLEYSGVAKKGKQKQPLMMIGSECEAILGAPQITIKECKLGTLTEDACKAKIQFIPPNT